MKITKVTTIVHEDFPNIVHVQITTDEGITGLGESYYFGSTVAHFINEFAAPTIIGMDPLDRLNISRKLTTYVGYNSSGVETRARSAIDLALWDIEGKLKNKPLYQLLGGTDQKKLRIYNTCAGRTYMRKSNQGSSSWGLDDQTNDLDDLRAFMNDAGTLGQELLSEGITAMKIWPFDIYAETNWGEDISVEDLKKGLAPIASIRSAVGEKMDIMVELHSLWRPLGAKKIMEALTDFNIFWVEDPLHPDLLDEFVDLRKDSFPRIAHGETIASRTRVKHLSERNLIDVLTLDMEWCGGLTEGIEFARIAQENGVKIAPHDCTGPVGLMVGAHLSTASDNALIQETVRSSLRTWYPHLVNGLPEISNGQLLVNNTPGHGLELTKEFFESSGAQKTVIS